MIPSPCEKWNITLRAIGIENQAEYPATLGDAPKQKSPNCSTEWVNYLRLEQCNFSRQSLLCLFL
jgi:hypothetical protein